MKNIISIAYTLLLTVSTLSAQEEFEASQPQEEKQYGVDRVYIYGGYGGALFSGEAVIFGLSMAMKEGWIASVGQLYARRKASAPFKFENLFGYPEYHPVAETRFTYMSLGATAPFNENSYLLIDAGVGVAQGQDFNYYKTFNGRLKPGEQLIDGASDIYTVTKTEKTSFGLILRVGFEKSLAKWAGSGVDLYYNYCAGGISDNMGIMFRFNLGYFSHKKKSEE